jgi:hypothetical protein
MYIVWTGLFLLHNKAVKQSPSGMYCTSLYKYAVIDVYLFTTEDIGTIMSHQSNYSTVNHVIQVSNIFIIVIVYQTVWFIVIFLSYNCWFITSSYKIIWYNIESINRDTSYFSSIYKYQYTSSILDIVFVI